MEAAAAVANMRSVQGALQVITALQLTAHFWPQQAHPCDGAQFDYVVVGAGSAGCVLASRLTEDPRVRVLLVEAGGDPPLESVVPGLFPYIPYTKTDWNYTSQYDGVSQMNLKNHVKHLTRGKMLGGSSSANYMLYVRGRPRDFDSWVTAVNDSTWRWENVLPYFIKSEKLLSHEVLQSPHGIYHGTDGYIAVTKQSSKKTYKYLEAFREIGNDIILDINGVDNLGVGEPMFTMADDKRQSTAYSFLSSNKHRSNLHVLKNALVTKIIFDDKKAAIGIKLETEEGKTLTIKAKREVILSAGAFNSPQLLMLSGLGPAKHLRQLNIDVIADLPDVGKNLQDHAAIMIAHKLTRLQSTPPPVNPYKFPVTVVTAYSALNKSQHYPDYQSIHMLIPANSSALLEFCAFTFNFHDDICQSMYDDSRGSDTFFSLLVPLHPKSRGEILLNSRNPRGHPLIYTKTYSDEDDIDNAAAYLQEYSRIVNTTYFKSVEAHMVYLKLPQCSGFERDSFDYWRCYAVHSTLTMWHYSGTCALGRVVDARLRVLGVRRLRVVDASVMPAITSGNINAPTIMIAEKAADFIKKDNNRC